MPDLSLLLIHYHTPELVGPALAAAVDDAEAAGLSWEAVVVDNGSTETGRTAWGDLERRRARRLDPGRNLGYAGGVNHGAATTTGRFMVALNPDVRVRPGCLGALVDALREGAGAAGPKFFLDEDERLLQPPTEERTRWARLLDARAARGFAAAAPARRRWRRHARRHWRAEHPLGSRSLSGALLAFPRRVWEQVPFDDGYALYFEEDDWLRRLEAAGHRTMFVPAARAIHEHDRSAAGEPRAADWFAESQERFERRWYGDWVPTVAGWLAGSDPSGWDSLENLASEVSGTGMSPPPETRWMELSPSPKGYPAAAERFEGDAPAFWTVPEDAWRGLAPGRYLAQAVADDGRELARRLLVKPTHTPGDDS